MIAARIGRALADGQPPQLPGASRSDLVAAFAAPTPALARGLRPAP